jgi:hypothetical protein
MTDTNPPADRIAEQAPLNPRIAEDVRAGMARALEAHRKIHPIWDDEHTTAANEYLHTRIASDIHHVLANQAGPGKSGGYTNHDAWKSKSADELVAAISTYLRGSLAPALSGVHAEVDAESAALIGYLKTELTLARMEIAELRGTKTDPAPQKPTRREPAPEPPGQGSLLEELEAAA